MTSFPSLIYILSIIPTMVQPFSITGERLAAMSKPALRKRTAGKNKRGDGKGWGARGLEDI
jgi:hypothetical protein